jgi:uncharacterized membrane protein
MTASVRRDAWLIVTAAIFVLAGANHFLHPKPYLSMMPAYLPAPKELVWISGIAEVAGGIAVLLPASRKAAGWGLIALLLAVFPANLNVALNGWPNVHLPAWLLWARLPLQPIMIWAVYRIVLAPRLRPRRNAITR